MSFLRYIPYNCSSEVSTWLVTFITQTRQLNHLLARRFLAWMILDPEDWWEKFLRNTGSRTDYRRYIPQDDNVRRNTAARKNSNHANWLINTQRNWLLVCQQISNTFLVRVFFLPWRWWRYVTQKWRFLWYPHGLILQETVFISRRRQSLKSYKQQHDGPYTSHHNRLIINKTNKKPTPWPEPASELYRPSDRRLSTKLV
jgi:hypothetical protein